MNTVTEPAPSAIDNPPRDPRRQAFEANKLSKKLHRQIGIIGDRLCSSPQCGDTFHRGRQS